MYGVPQGSVLGLVLCVLYTAPLSDMIDYIHSVNSQLFADDTQIQKSAPLTEVTSLTKEIVTCTDDIKTWMSENQLRLNDDNTSVSLFVFLETFPPKREKKSFSTNFSPIPKKTTSAIPFSQPIEQDTAPRLFCYVL